MAFMLPGQDGGRKRGALWFAAIKEEQPHKYDHYEPVTARFYRTDAI